MHAGRSGYTHSHDLLVLIRSLQNIRSMHTEHSVRLIYEIVRRNMKTPHRQRTEESKVNFSLPNKCSKRGNEEKKSVNKVNDEKEQRTLRL